MATAYKKALIADDSPTTRKFIGLTLKSLGFDVLLAEDGMEALEMLPREKFSLIITDLNMPNMDGLEFIRQVRANDFLKEVPVIVLSSINDAGIKTACLEAGASSFLVKPFNPAKIKYEVSKVI